MTDFEEICTLIDEAKETAALKARIAELESMLADKDDALRFYAKDIGSYSGHSLIAKGALALTPADTVEAAKNKDALINKMLVALRYYNTFFGTDPAAIYAFEAIEAARSAGVEVE